MGRLEVLTGDHFREYYADFVPQDIVGYALRGDDGRLKCLGGIWFIEGHAWATFASDGAPPPSVHRIAIRLVQTVREAGVKVIWAELDASIPKARKWLERFGFVHHSDTLDGIEVWRLDLDGGLHNQRLRPVWPSDRHVRRSL